MYSKDKEAFLKIYPEPVSQDAWNEWYTKLIVWDKALDYERKQCESKPLDPQPYLTGNVIEAGWSALDDINRLVLKIDRHAMFSFPHNVLYKDVVITLSPARAS